MDSESNLKEEVVLAYSGGTDSTLAAVYLLKEFKKVTLLTIRLHNCLFFRNKAKKLAAGLEGKYGRGRVNHKFLDSRELYNEIRKDGKIFENIYKYGFFTALTHFCPTCVLTIMATGFIYCLENGIPYFAMGFNALQGSKDYGQSSIAINNFVKWGREFGIAVLNPVYQINATDKELFDLRISSQPDIQSKRTLFSGYPFLRPTQASCPLPLIYVVYKLGIANPILGSRRVMGASQKYLEEKWNTVCKNYIKEYFQKKFININTRIENLIESLTPREKEEHQTVKIPRRIIMDDIGLLVIIAGLLFGGLAVKITRSVMWGVIVFLFIWCFFLYNHMAIRTKLKADKKSFIFKD